MTWTAWLKLRAARIVALLAAWLPQRPMPTTAAERLAVCRACPELRKPGEEGLVDTCRLCQCFMPMKVRVRAARCPHRKPKWGPMP